MFFTFQALVSMRLQHEAHQRQEKILNLKWRRSELQREKARKEREKKKVEMKQKNEKRLCSEKENFFVKELEVIDNKKGSSSVSSLVISAENFSVASSVSSLSETSAVKDDKTLVDDLPSQVNELKIQVLSLSQELEDSNRQNTKLKQTIQTLKEFIAAHHGVEILDSILENQTRILLHSDSMDYNSYSAEKNCKADATCAEEISKDKKMSVNSQSQESEELGGSLGINNIEDFMQSTKTEEQACSAFCETDENKIQNIDLPPLEIPQFHFLND